MPTMKALINAMSNDSNIAAKLSTFDFGSGAAPAVFANARPDESPMRSAVVTMVGGYDVGANATYAMWVQHDIRLEDDRDRSQKELLELAWLVYYKFHKKELAIGEDGFDTGDCFCGPPMLIGFEDFPGYLVQVRVLLAKGED